MTGVESRYFLRINGHPRAGWTYKVLYSFSSNVQYSGNLALDSAGNLYGTTIGYGPARAGNVFMLSSSGGGWTYKDLYVFQAGNDGCYPYAGVVFDNAGNLYGTAYNCGAGGAGVVWEITP